MKILTASTLGKVVADISNIWNWNTSQTVTIDSHKDNKTVKRKTVVNITRKPGVKTNPKETEILEFKESVR